MDNKTPLLVLGLYTPGMNMLRKFSKLNIPVYGADCDQSLYGFKTKYGEKYQCPDALIYPEKWLEWMLDFKQKTGYEKIVLISTSDRYTIPMEEYSVELSNEGYIFYYNKKGVVKKITSKRGMYDYSLEFNFPSPLTCFPCDDKDLIQFFKKISFPVICKPEFSKQWLSAEMIKITNWKKVIVLNDEKSCLELYKLMSSKNIPVIFQEIIEGEDDELLYQITHISETNEVLSYFIGKKNRITPVHFGSASYVETVVNEELSKSINKFLLDMGFRGISGVEVKYDYKSKNYKLIEINPRYGLWDELGEHIGKDIALNAFNNLTGEITSKNEIPTKKIYWFSIHRDASAFVEYNKIGLLTLKEFIKSYKQRPRIISDLYSDDFSVSLMTIKQVLKSIIKYILFNKLRIRHD